MPVRMHDIVNEALTSSMIRIGKSSTGIRVVVYFKEIIFSWNKIYLNFRMNKEPNMHILQVTTDEKKDDEQIQDMDDKRVEDMDRQEIEWFLSTQIIFEDKGVQVMILNNTAKFNDLQHLMTSHKSLSNFTAVNLDLFHSIEKSIAIILTYFPNVNTCNIELQICRVLTKFKLDMSLRNVAVIFSLSHSTAPNYFYEIFQLLAYALKPAIYWPIKKENIASMPKCFVNYQNVKVMTDVTEICIQKNNCLKCRIRTYSHSKK